MKRVFTLVLCALATLGVAAQQNVQITSAVGQDITNFIRTNFLGEGVYVYNVTFNGQSGIIPSRYPQIGSFVNTGFPCIEMSKGILVTTGHIDAAKGPNTFPYYNIPLPEADRYVDPEINNQGLADNAVTCGTIDFDFVCLATNVMFSYSFGSEEYNEFVGSLYHDVFVFLLTGPDPTTGQVVTRNIAMIPGSEDDEHPNGIPVSTSTVNNGIPPDTIYSSGFGYSFDYSQYFCDNDYDSTYAKPGVQYDGLTRKLVAQGGVIPCQVYHMHISVCNIGSNHLDSGVFIEGNSFGTPTGQIGIWQNEIENIPQGTEKVIPISLAGTEYDNATVYARFGGDAVNGFDYVCFADDGTVLNEGDHFTIDNNQHSISIIPVDDADFTTPKTLDVYISMALCPETPELLTYDTLHYVLTPGNSNPGGNEGIDVVEHGLVALHPNPVADKLTVSAAAPMQSVVIVDMAGREVSATAVDGGTTATIDVSRLEKGVYTVGVTLAAGGTVNRVMVK